MTSFLASVVELWPQTWAAWNTWRKQVAGGSNKTQWATTSLCQTQPDMSKKESAADADKLVENVCRLEREARATWGLAEAKACPFQDIKTVCFSLCYCIHDVHLSTAIIPPWKIRLENKIMKERTNWQEVVQTTDSYSDVKKMLAISKREFKTVVDIWSRGVSPTWDPCVLTLPCPGLGFQLRGDEHTRTLLGWGLK